MAENKDKKREEEKNRIGTFQEFKDEQRKGFKEGIDRFTRVAGIGAILFLVFAGIFEPLFEISFFGRLFTPEKYKLFWGTDGMGTDGFIKRSGIFEDWANLGTWLPKIGVTLIYLAVIIAAVAFITYVLVDITTLFKSFGKSMKDNTVGLYENVKVTYQAENEPKTKKEKKKEKKVEEIEKKEIADEDPFAKYEQKPEEKKAKPKKEKEVKEKPAKEPKPKRREEDDFDDAKLQAMLLSGDQSAIDAIYNGGGRIED